MLSESWITFFEINAQIAIGLAAILFIGFSKYFNEFDLDELESKIIRFYYIELLFAFFISIVAIMPPFWLWGIPAMILSIYYFVDLCKFMSLVFTYQHAEGFKKEILEIYQLQTKNWWFPMARCILIFIASVIGLYSFLAKFFPIFTFNFGYLLLEEISLYIIGTMLVLNLVSSIIGSWSLLQQFKKRPKIVTIPNISKQEKEKEAGMRQETMEDV